MHRIRIQTLVLTLFALTSFFGVVAVFAQETVDELRQNISDTQREIEQLQKEIQEYEGQISEINEEKDSLKGEIKRIDITRNKISTDIKLTEKKILAKNNLIEDLNNQITEKEQKVIQHKDVLTQSIKLINQQDEQSFFERLLAHETLSEFWVDLDNLQRFQEDVQNQILELQGLKVSLKEDQIKTAEQKNELEGLKDEKLSQKKLVDQNRSEKDNLLKRTENEEAQYQRILTEKKRLQQAFENELQEYESKLLFILDPTLLPQSGSGVLSWPLDEIVVTQMFGVRDGPHRIYANGHSGTDFRARTPQKLYAMADGVVMGVGDTDIACRGASFGKWIAIKFDNNLVATYAHLSLINVETGARVLRGQVIGYTGNTGRTTAPHLHISLYAGIDANGDNPVEVRGLPSKACKGKTLIQPRAARNAYLDIIDYLPPMDSSMFKSGIKR